MPGSAAGCWTSLPPRCAPRLSAACHRELPPVLGRGLPFGVAVRENANVLEGSVPVFVLRWGTCKYGRMRSSSRGDRNPRDEDEEAGRAEAGPRGP